MEIDDERMPDLPELDGTGADDDQPEEQQDQMMIDPELAQESTATDAPTATATNDDDDQEQEVQGAKEAEAAEEEEEEEQGEDQAIAARKLAANIFDDSDSDLSDAQSDEEEEEEEEGAATTKLANIFDEPDDDDEEEEDEEEGSSRKARARSVESATSDQRQEREEEEEEEEEADSDDREEGDEYQDEEDKIRRMKIKKKKKDRAADGEGGEEVRKKKKKKDKNVEKVQDDIVEEELDPEQARRKALNERFDAILRPNKNKSGGKKRKGADEDDLDMMNDERVAQLRTEMLKAADSDLTENESGRFAPNKLRMLPVVVEMMQKTALGESLIENGVLEAVKRWLEPLPDKSLPAVNIQRALFENLKNLPIETSALKSSGLGKVVYFYTKCKRVEPFISRMANQLVSDWMRPIIRRSKAFVDKEAPSNDLSQPRRPIRAPSGSVGTVSRKVDDDAGIARRHARIPEQLTASFTIAPPMSARDRQESNAGLQSGAHSITAVSSKMKGYKKKLVAGQQASRRV